MATHLYRLGHAAMTVDLQVRFKLPVPSGKIICFKSSVENLTKRLWTLTSQAKLPSGEIALTARAKMMKAKFELDGKVFDYAKKPNLVTAPKSPGNVQEYLFQDLR